MTNIPALNNPRSMAYKVPQSFSCQFARLILFLFFPLISCGFLNAEPLLPHLFSDHMVFQRDMEASVWGQADAGEPISVTLGAHSAKTVADANGQWTVSLPPTPAGGPFVLTVRGKKTIFIKDVMFGEVWIASGQSNMTYALKGAAGASEEIPKADYPGIRLFTVPKKIALEPQADTLPAHWEPCTPATAQEFSAVGYYFARDLHKALGVPVGIILSAWPGTLGEEWTDPESLRSQHILQPILRRWEAEPPNVKAFARSADFSLEFDDFELLRAPGDARPPLIFSNFDDGSSRTQTGGQWSYSWPDAPNSLFELAGPGRGGAGYSARISGKLDGASSSLWEARFTANGTPANLSAFSGIQFWARGNGSFQLQTLQPTISDWDNYSGPLTQATPDWTRVVVKFADLKQAGWGVPQPFTPQALIGFFLNTAATAGYPDRPPSGLYDGMIAPLERYRIRGALWYQGESNTVRAFQYRTLLPSLIRGWRKAWNENDFPFLIVQLPNLGDSPPFGDSIWAEMREAQLLTAKTVPNTGLAVTIDVGDRVNLHPPRKEEIGERLALWALGTIYGRKIVYSGPIYDSMEISGGEVRLSFQHVGSGLIANGGPLAGFTMAGADRKFHAANARIEGNQIIVSSAEVSAPIAVRYAWANSPQCNLFNKDGFPASPFRTDDWPGASFAQR